MWYLWTWMVWLFLLPLSGIWLPCIFLFQNVSPLFHFLKHHTALILPTHRNTEPLPVLISLSVKCLKCQPLSFCMSMIHIFWNLPYQTTLQFFAWFLLILLICHFLGPSLNLGLQTWSNFPVNTWHVCSDNLVAAHIYLVISNQHSKDWAKTEE